MESESQIKGIIFARAWWEAVRDVLSNEQRVAFYDMVFEYAFAGRQISSGRDAVYMAFAMVKPFIDQDIIKYQERCERNRRNAQGRKPKEASGTQSLPVATNTNTNNNTNTNTNNNTISLDEERERFLCLGIIFGNGAADTKDEFERFWNYYESLGWRNNKGAEIKRKTSAASMWQPAERLDEKQISIRSLWYDCMSKAGCNDIRVFVLFRNASAEGENLVISAGNVKEFAEVVDGFYINQLRRFAAAMGCSNVTYRD